MFPPNPLFIVGPLHSIDSNILPQLTPLRVKSTYSTIIKALQF